MSGPKPPEWDPEEPDSVNEAPHQPDSDIEPADVPEPGHVEEIEPFDDGAEPAAGDTGQTDAYSRAYSAPESEHFMSGPYLPADLRLYDYDTFDESAEAEDEHGAPRWPWVVGVAAIVAAIALVVSVSLLFARTDTTKLANPNTTTVPSTPPMQDEITTTKPPPPPPPPPPPTTEPPPPPPTETQTVTVTPAPAPPPAPAPAPPPATSTAAPPTGRIDVGHGDDVAGRLRAGHRA
ncbi:hypothetical protein, partial [Mycobacterium sp. 852002-53434_SCH5985345]|uniref:hypothetical protein n=1 Tax=Mycobacterium sp. 852002-53434_SCH5985345 TaxID=1834107 RepID=UPI003514BA1B